jgi:chromosome segregation ATPase
MGKKETAAYLGISVNELNSLLAISINNNDINNKGGERRMSLTFEELEDKVKTLEAGAEASKNQIIEQAKTIETLEDSIKTMEAEKDTFLAETDGLKAKIAEQEKYVEIGQNVIADLKADIKKISIQVDGNDYEEELVDKQLEAFGDDYESLKSFCGILKKRRGKMFKTGELNPDEVDDDVTSRERKQYATGRAIAQAKIIPIKK